MYHELEIKILILNKTIFFIIFICYLNIFELFLIN